MKLSFLRGRRLRRSCSTTTEEEEEEAPTNHEQPIRFVIGDTQHPHSQHPPSYAQDHPVFMNNTTNNAIGVELGRPSKRVLRKIETMTFTFHDFITNFVDEDGRRIATYQRGQYFTTPKLQAHGYTWMLQLFPRGDHNSSHDTETVSCYVHYFQESSSNASTSASSAQRRPAPTAKITYRVGEQRTRHRIITQLCDFTIQPGKCSSCWGLENFITRQKLIDKCLDVEGALTIKVDIQLAIERKQIWYPPPLHREATLTQLYGSALETGDVTFRVQHTHYYPAHTIILALRATVLYELATLQQAAAAAGTEEEDENTMHGNKVMIDLPANIDCQAFAQMLDYVYTVQVPLLHDRDAATRLLILADYFDLPDLKLYIESVLAEHFVTEMTAADFVLMGEAYSCPLLKEIAMDTICYADDDPKKSILTTSGWLLLQESATLAAEVRNHVPMAYRQLPGVDTNTSTDIDSFDVFALRERLYEAGQDLDGSREILVARLKNL